MPKRKQQIVFAPIFLDGEGKRTLSPTRVEKETHDGVVTEFQHNNTKTDRSQPLNRKSKRYLEALNRKRA